MLPEDLKILKFLKDQRGFDFSGYRAAMIKRRLEQRLALANCRDSQAYWQYLLLHPEELDGLLGALTINVSRFFRDTLTFEYLGDRLLPAILTEKGKVPLSSFRIWSAGCANGEEPYSIAILIHELFRKENFRGTVDFFATDIDPECLNRAQEGRYRKESLQGVKFGILEKYFHRQGDWFQLAPEIRSLVDFSLFSLLDPKSQVPPESVFGDFDLILCRNVLIFFNVETQQQVFDRLYRSLNKGGYLVLGEAESPPSNSLCLFQRVNDCCHIYRKI